MGKRSLLTVALTLGIGGMLAPATARGHGAVAISQQLMWRGNTMLVQAAYWGVFVGSEGGDWRWICEEAISGVQSRLMSLGKDGTLFASDRTGLRVSRDSGCSWESVTADLDSLVVYGLVSELGSARTWALANSADGSGNGLWSSDDSGRSWQRRYAMPTYAGSALLGSADDRTLVISSLTSDAPPQLVLHVSLDGGATFSAQPLVHELDGKALTTVSPLWVDPRVAGRIYLAAPQESGSVVLRVDGTAAPVEVLRTPALIYAMERSPDAGSDGVFIGTSKGIYSSQAGGPFALLGTVGSAQCLSAHGSALYACTWNYFPDFAAIARLKGDASAFSPVFQFGDTQGPIDCPAGTSVAQICPAYWASYSSQLSSQPTLPTPPPMTGEASGCQLTRREAPSPRPGPGGALFALGLATLGIGYLATRGRLRRRSPRDSAGPFG